MALLRGCRAFLQTFCRLFCSGGVIVTKCVGFMCRKGGDTFVFGKIRLIVENIGLYSGLAFCEEGL